MLKAMEIARETVWAVCIFFPVRLCSVLSSTSQRLWQGITRDSVILYLQASFQSEMPHSSEVSWGKVEVLTRAHRRLVSQPTFRMYPRFFSLLSLGVMAMGNILQWPGSAESSKWSCHPCGGETYQQTRLDKNWHSARTLVRWREGWQASREAVEQDGRKQLAV